MKRARARRRAPRKGPDSRREQILRVATDMFHRDGVAKTNLESIARKVGIRTASLYHHFEDKQAILDSIVDRAHGEIVSRAEEAARRHPEPLARRDAVIDELVAVLVGNTAVAAVGRNDRGLASSPVRRRSERAEDRLVSLLSSIVADARPETNPRTHRALAHGVIGVLWSITHADLGLPADALREHLRSAARVVVTGHHGKDVRRGAARPRSARGAA